MFNMSEVQNNNVINNTKQAGNAMHEREKVKKSLLIAFLSLLLLVFLAFIFSIDGTTSSTENAKKEREIV
jgi:Trk-type K+ transport system membrane component